MVNGVEKLKQPSQLTLQLPKDSCPNPFATAAATRDAAPVGQAALPGLAGAGRAIPELPDAETQPQTAGWTPFAQAYELLPTQSLHLHSALHYHLIRGLHMLVYQPHENLLKQQIYYPRWTLRGRNCTEFTEWQQGFTPKEHREMLDRKRLLEFQTRREDNWQSFQAQMAADDKNWREEQDRKAEKRHRVEIIIFGIGVILAILLGAVIQAGWVPTWFRLAGG